MLDLLRENQAAMQDFQGAFKHAVSEASKYLKILDPKRGDKELVKAMAVELANLYVL